MLVVIAGCGNGVSAADPEPAGPVPTALRLTLTGETGAVLGDGTTIPVALLARGEEEPRAAGFENGASTILDLPPGRYTLAGIGPLECRGLEFEVGPSGVRALGALNGEIVVTDYCIALMSSRAVTGDELAELAAATGVAVDDIDARPLPIAESAPCFIGRGGPGTTWRERPLGEKILLGVGIAAFCAAAVASGGLCVF